MEALQEVLLEIAILGFMALGTWIASELRRFIRSKADGETLELLGKLAEAAVWAVEQSPTTGVFATKKEAARSIIEKQLAEVSLLGKFPTSTIDAAIEAAVGQNFHYSKHTREEAQG